MLGSCTARITYVPWGMQASIGYDIGLSNVVCVGRRQESAITQNKYA